MVAECMNVPARVPEWFVSSRDSIHDRERSDFSCKCLYSQYCKCTFTIDLNLLWLNISSVSVVKNYS